MSLYRHNDEGPDDMPAHIKSALTQTQLTIPVTTAGSSLASGKASSSSSTAAAPASALVGLTF